MARRTKLPAFVQGLFGPARRLAWISAGLRLIHAAPSREIIDAGAGARAESRIAPRCAWQSAGRFAEHPARAFGGISRSAASCSKAAPANMVN